ncbi:uncharacterized protein [Elaeis guineensis]|uniref:LOW QUALITY PROTEIN: uncharacterized protein LOC105047146 n=1 Tax=Elaeis guineensis var. tenera TaxID=51953 RepID=A0A6I9RJK8_ELAGV|nr:LOW QUALITY PROTEIN: uncharacterized protein LOC105047146 [Elaeis guineensis]
MGNLMSFFFDKEPPPPMVLVPPIFDFPPLAARTRMLVPAYDLLFGKLALRSLFEDYFEQARNLNTRIMLKPLEDPHVDLLATVSGPLDQKSGKAVEGNALFRWQKDLDDPHTFMDLMVSTFDPILRLRSCAYYPRYQFGAFGIFPLVITKRALPEDYGVMGLRYGSENLSIGTSFMPFPLSGDTPICAWLVGRSGRLSVGLKYITPYEGKHLMNFKDLKNWSCAIGYGLGSSSPLCPSFNFSLELARSSQLTASFYQHAVVQRRVTNPFEENQIVGITNYIDFGFELVTRINGDKSLESVDESSFQLAASWQANKNFLLKGKMGPSSSSIALAFKSWWRPSFTFSITAMSDRLHGTTSYGFGIRVEDLREPSYQRADPNYVMLTPNKEHLAEGVLRNFGKRPMFQKEIDSGNFDHLPRELKPIGKIF